MCSMLAIILLAASRQTHAKDSMDNLVKFDAVVTDRLADKLSTRTLFPSLLHSADLDETTVNKPGHLTKQQIPTAFHSRPVASSSRIASFPLSGSRPRIAYTTARAVKMPPADLTPAVDKFPRLPKAGDMKPELDFASAMMSSEALDSRAVAPIDPFKMVEKDLEPLSKYVTELVQSENPVLTMAASHFFEQRQGKRFRPTIVALVGRALAPNGIKEDVAKKQLQLGQITEMIHVASLIHDDVLDVADTRRGGQAVHIMYTNKVAVLAGDYLLARASMLLARLQHLQVVEVMASALEALVQGEIMQARSKKEDLTDFDHYLRKSYYKTASLISCACKSTALLAGYEENQDLTVASEEFGYHLGMAFQIVDDILDFTGASDALGKPAQADMQLGLATAPILYASQSEPSLKPLIERRFKQEGDVQKAVAVAKGTDCVQQSRKLAEFHAQKGIDALMRFPQSQSRLALLQLMQLVLSRNK
eukprot:gnl/MRDRNA2_/MRDRNA2_92995_c0_seq1.p1 gnl/MRDRNA2_/MRDRNA2_92995_c0~~gnl/MRDRNA2_/MRDRNA2_92995_c0_seq1.p1  ORF type:complete len:478 (-),score=80.93 gnl/MRDRNA2_/MRDRNA2_92995_c0_seq1:282-1715(-)